MMKLKKKVRKMVSEDQDAGAQPGPEARPPAPTVTENVELERLRKENAELRKVADRMSVIEKDITNVHRKLDNIDGSNAGMTKELTTIRSTVTKISDNVGVMARTVVKASKKFGITDEDLKRIKEVQRTAQPRPTKPKISPPPSPKPAPVASPAQSPLSRPRGPPPPAVRELELKEASVFQIGPIRTPRTGKDEVHEKSVKRMDEVKTVAEGDMDSLEDEVVTSDGRRLPVKDVLKIAKKEVKEAMGERMDGDETEAEEGKDLGKKGDKIIRPKRQQRQ